VLPMCEKESCQKDGRGDKVGEINGLDTGGERGAFPTERVNEMHQSGGLHRQIAER